MRKLCNICQKNPVAINYYKNNKVFYRSKCDHCARGSKVKRPLWEKVGYQKKLTCDKCGFRSPHQEVFNVFYVDDNLTNHQYGNLKTICANCQRILHKDGVKWKQGDLKPDF